MGLVLRKYQLNVMQSCAVRLGNAGFQQKRKRILKLLNNGENQVERVDGVSNDKLFKRIQEGSTHLETLNGEKDMIWYIIRGKEILTTIIESTVDGRKIEEEKHSRSQMMSREGVIKEQKRIGRVRNVRDLQNLYISCNTAIRSFNAIYYGW